MNILQHLDEWMTGRAELPPYQPWLNGCEDGGDYPDHSYLTWGFFCVEDAEVFT